MTTTHFTYHFDNPDFFVLLKRHNVPTYSSRGETMTVVPVYRENALLDVICDIAEELKLNGWVHISCENDMFVHDHRNIGFKNGVEQ